MSVEITTSLKNTTCDSIVGAIDSGSANSNGYLEIRSGTRPLSPQNSASGTLLATLNFSAVAFGDAVDGVATANTITEDTSIDATGVASWFRIYDKDGNAVMDGDITVTGGSGDIEFDDINFVEGGTALISSLTGVVL